MNNWKHGVKGSDEALLASPVAVAGEAGECPLEEEVVEPEGG